MSKPIEKLFEHACSQEAGNGVCRSRGGESCAFDGAMVVLQCIADTAHLVHGPIACFGNSWESRGTVSHKGELHKQAYTTDLTELDIVYGAEEKLFKAILETAQTAEPKAIFVYNTCVTGLTGENIGQVCQRASKVLDFPVIPVDAPGFVGPKNLGNRIAGQVLLDHVIGTDLSASMRSIHINLIGEYNIAGDLDLVEPLFAAAGIEVGARITGNGTFGEIARAHSASLNVMVCSRALINVAQEMEARYAIPFVEVSFFGRTEMSHALRVVSAQLERITGRRFRRPAEVVIGSEQKRLADRLAPYGHLKGKKAVLYTGGVKSWSMISALMDLGIQVVAVGTKKSTREDEEKMRHLLGPEAPLHESMTPAKIRDLMQTTGADMLIAGGRNQYLAIKEGYPFVDVNQERHTPYAGYEGLVNLAEAIDQTLSFYAGPAGRGGPRVVQQARPVAINPLKHSPAMGAAMALQGVHRALPVMHGAQGCNFLGKVLLTKHFREPIAMMSSKLFAEEVVMGSEEKLSQVVSDQMERQSPRVIAIVTTALSEVKGDHVSPVIQKLTQRKSCHFHISAPDYAGGLEAGYRAALTALVEAAEPGETVSGRVNVLVGSHLTPADVETLRGWCLAFGLVPVILPDLSVLDGSRQVFSPLALGGTTLESIRGMGRAEITLVIGPSLVQAAESLQMYCGVPFKVFHTLSGVGGATRFFAFLQEFSGRALPADLDRARRVLIDGMGDAQTVFGGKGIVVAQEGDLALQTASWLREMNVAYLSVVLPTCGSAAADIPADEVVVGDFASVPTGYDLLISNSHGVEVAKRLGTAHYPMGFPVFETLGINNRVTIGYGGTLNLVHSVGNRLMGGES